MNFTREPIIETVITPREGCKLVVRSSKANGQEEYFVDAIEVVSFGRSFFFRSLERPKSFLVPVSDYEILELKETRMVLKSANTERSIKIGGGREAAPFRAPREEGEEMRPLAQPLPERGERGGAGLERGKRSQRRRSRRGSGGRSGERQESAAPQPPPSFEEREESIESSLSLDEVSLPPAETAAPLSEEVKAPSFISKLFPPPPTLIKETLSRYKLSEPSEEPTLSGEDPLDAPIPLEEEEGDEEA